MWVKIVWNVYSHVYKLERNKMSDWEVNWGKFVFWVMYRFRGQRSKQLVHFPPAVGIPVQQITNLWCFIGVFINGFTSTFLRTACPNITPDFEILSMPFWNYTIKSTLLSWANTVVLICCTKINFYSMNSLSLLFVKKPIVGRQPLQVKPSPVYPLRGSHRSHVYP